MTKTSTQPEATTAPPKEDPLAVLSARLTELEDRLSATDAENTVLEETIASMRLDMEAGGITEEVEAEVLYDPFYSKNPYQIIGEIPPDDTYPEGQVLGWKNESHRESRRGWRGWLRMSYGDKYTGKEGDLLANYIVDPPPRLLGSSKMDNYVRRATDVLCRLDKRIFDSRQKQRTMSNRASVARAGSSTTQVLRDGIELTGAGLRKQDRPAGGFKRGEKYVAAGHSRNLLKPQEE